MEASAKCRGEMARPIRQQRDFFRYSLPGTGHCRRLQSARDGVIRAAFDACDVCWPENKGYSQKGDFMVCNNCGKKFSSVRINEVQGGCNPAPLNRKVENSSVVLQAADLLQGKRYFDLRGVKR